MPEPSIPPLSEWRPSAGQEPFVRVGIVLPEDHATRITISTAGHWHEYAADGDRVTFSQGDRRGVHDMLTIVPSGPTSAGSDAALRSDSSSLPVVHDVRTGRGFHWEKRTDMALPGRLVVSSRGGHLLVVNEAPIEAYLAGVITSEMSGDCPLEFLKSQAVVARSWLLAQTERKHRDLGIDYCNDDCCQRYQGLAALSDNARRAILETYGEVLWHERGVIVDANYSKSCGGIVEAPQHAWGGIKPGQYAVADGPPGGLTETFFGRCDDRLTEYLSGDWLKRCDAYCSPNVVPDAELPRYLGRVDDGAGRFRWTVEYTRPELESALRNKFFDRVGPDSAAPMHTLLDLIPQARGQSGRITALGVRYLDQRGTERTATLRDQYWIRHALSPSFLYSSAFMPQIERDAAGLPSRIRLIGAGWGHGAGLCQIGALGMALLGRRCEEILAHYFERSTIRAVYSRPR